MSLLNQYLKTIGQTGSEGVSPAPLPSILRGRGRKRTADRFFFRMVLLSLVPVLSVAGMAWHQIRHNGHTRMEQDAGQAVLTGNRRAVETWETKKEPSLPVTAGDAASGAGVPTAEAMVKGNEQGRPPPHPEGLPSAALPSSNMGLTVASTAERVPQGGMKPVPRGNEALLFPSKEREGLQGPQPLLPEEENDPVLRVQEEAQSVYHLGLIAFQEGNLAGAEYFFHETLKKTPHDMNVLVNLSNVYIRQDRLDVAEKVLQKVQAMHGGNTKSLNNLGVVALRRKDREAARLFFNRSVEINPSDEIALTNLAYLAQTENNLVEARHYYDKIIKMNPENADVLLRLAHLEAQEGRTEYAIHLYNRCLKSQGVQNDPLLAQKIRTRINLMRVHE